MTPVSNPGPTPAESDASGPRIDVARPMRSVGDFAWGSKVLVTGPPGSGKSRFVLGLFDAIVREAGPDAALLVLPTYGEVEHAKRLAITRRGDGPHVRGLLDVSYATFTSLRERFAPEFRVRALPSRAERDRLAARALEAADAPLFRAVRDRPGFRARFLRLVKELKQSGHAPAELLARAREAARALADGPRERWSAFLDAFERYEALLLEAGTPDHEDALVALVGEVSRPVAHPAALRLLVVDGFDDFSGIEARLLEVLSRRVAQAGGVVFVTLPFDDARASLYPATVTMRARLLGREGYVEHRLHDHRRASGPLERLARELFRERAAGTATAGPAAESIGEDRGAASPGSSPTPDRPVVSAIVGADPADEWDRIGREVLARVRAGDGTGFRDVGVIVRRLDAVEPIARRAFAALGVPIRVVGGGEALATQAVVRAIRGPLRLLAGDDGEDDRAFEAHAILEYLRWRALDSGRPVDVAHVDATDHRWRSEHLPTSWTSLRDDLRTHAPASLAPVVERIEEVRATLSHAVDPIGVLERFVADALPLRAASALDAQGRPTDPAADARLARARAAKRRLLDALGEARAGAAGPTLTVGALVGDLLAGAHDTTCEPPDRRLDAVSLLDAEEARHWELPVVFVAGLVEKAFPLHPREDLFLRDEDRDLLAARWGGEGAEGGVPWRTTRDAETGERRLFLGAMTRARDRLYLTRAARDEGGREVAPSFYWRDVAIALGLAPDGPSRFGADPADLDRSAPPLREVVTVGDLRRHVASARPLGRPALLRAGVGPESDADVGSWLARAARFLRPLADPLPVESTPAFASATRVLSPTDVQAGFDCPHRFFLARVACVPQDDVPMRGTTADRRHFGTWIHAALEAAVKEPALRDEEIVAAVLAAKAKDIPDDADRAWYADDLLRIVALFRVRERAAAASGFAPSPRDVEIAFGGKGHEVRLGMGAGAFELAGRIDRLDTDAGGGARRAIVVDYKTSVTTTSRAAASLRRVEDLQLALYARAIEGPRGVTVVGLEHYAGASPARVATIDERAEEAFTARREGHAPRVLATAAFREGLIGKAERRASAAVEAIRLGAGGGHVKRPRTRATCERCAFASVCRPDPLTAPLLARDADDALLCGSNDEADDEPGGGDAT